MATRRCQMHRASHSKRYRQDRNRDLGPGGARSRGAALSRVLLLIGRDDLGLLLRAQALLVLCAKEMEARSAAAVLAALDAAAHVELAARSTAALAAGGWRALGQRPFPAGGTHSAP